MTPFNCLLHTNLFFFFFTFYITAVNVCFLTKFYPNKIQRVHHRWPMKWFKHREQSWRNVRAAETKIAPEMSTQKQRARLFQASFNTSELSLSTVEHAAERHKQQGRRRKKTHPVSEQALKVSAMSFHSFNMRDYVTDALFPSRRTAVTCTGYTVTYTTLCIHDTWAPLFL